MTGQKVKLGRIGNPVPHPLGSGKNTKVSPWLAHASLFSSTTSRRLVAGQTSGGENYEAKPPVTTPMVNTTNVPGDLWLPALNTCLPREWKTVSTTTAT